MRKLLLLIAFAGLPLLAGCPPPTDNTAHDKRVFNLEKALFIETIYYQSFTPELLKEALYYCEIKSPDIVYRQAVHETGHFTSDLFYYGNNLTGMKRARVRETTAKGTYKHHASYVHWFSSVKDYKLLQNYYENNGYNLNQYYTFLHSIGYATDKEYIRKLKGVS